MGRLIDTTEVIAVERRTTSPADAATQIGLLASGAFIAAIQVAELALGMHLADSPARATHRRTVLNELLRVATLIPLGEIEAREVARLQAVLRRMGTPIGDRDLQIAATALVHGHEVVTRNVKDFAKIPGLIVIDAAAG